MTETNPAEGDINADAQTIILAPSVQDPESGALWIHRDYMNVIEPYAAEQHVGPIKAEESFGDVESWVSYVQEYAADMGGRFLTWNAQALRAVMDYTDGNEAGRNQWIARCPFTRSAEWEAWTRTATGQGIPHKKAIEFFEDHAEDITEPSPAELTNLLRLLRSNVTANATTELRPDGTTFVGFNQDKSVKAGSVDLPPEFQIAIPVLRGHVDADGKAVRYALTVRLRASVGDDAHLALRLSIPAAERVLEEVFAERVQSAKELLGDEFKILRAAD